MTIPVRAAAMTALCALAGAVTADAMPLQNRQVEPAVGARPSNTYFGPGSQAASRNVPGSDEVEVAPQWMRDQEVMSVRTGAVEFLLRMENIAGYDSLVFSDGTSQAAGFSHGVYAVHESGWPIYRPDSVAVPGSGLEELGEDGNVRPMQHYLETHPDVYESGIFYKPVGWDKDGELWPGDAYEVRFSADPGEKLSITTMLMQSNDIVYGPHGGRLDLFDEDGVPLVGDISAMFGAYDVGTEVNEDPKSGPNVGMNQSGLNSGVAEVVPITAPDDGFDYPPTPEVLKITLERVR